ncbi:MAG: excisionase [Gammaproteobacteria bacterium]|nr:excisionase [Gammaproteobacteria bacterium]MBU0785481.1 excisionase [Gammaproteobacteria bacterium]MBU0813681.1 excisionase [Gammaproteobacteria bacterium]MBU1788847.1 excisionase [Gammaproteobacteria bacterium]
MPRAAHARHVTIALASTITGLSAKAIRRKIEDGKWLEGREYNRRDNGIFIDMRGFDAWVERGRQ